MNASSPVEIILGVDPGLTCTGWGIVKRESLKLIYVDSGCLRTKSSTVMAERLSYLYEEIVAICRKHSVTRGAVEAGYVGTGAMSALKLGQARACAVLAIQRETGRVVDIAPREVKLSITGNGASSKQQVSYMVAQILGIEFDRGEEDISDALAVALAAANARQIKPLAART